MAREKESEFQKMSRIIKEKDRKLELLQFQLEEGQKMHDQDN